MFDSVYKVIELVGTSEKSWEDAAKQVVDTACKTLKDLRVVEVVKQDMKIEEGRIVAYRTRVHVSFKFEK
jgi:hypothetical protein